MQPLLFEEIKYKTANANLKKSKTALNLKINYKNKFYNLDVLDYLKILNNESVDLFILDPPYYKVVNKSWDKQWNKFKECLTWWNKVIKLINLKAKNSCSIWVFGFPYQLSRMINIFA